jgi:hypothetical protein
MSDEPRLEIIKVPDLFGEQWRAERARKKDESRRRYHDRLVAVLGAVDRSSTGVDDLAAAVLDALFVFPGEEDKDTCACACHPHLPEGDLHDYGFDCPCQHTAEERSEWFNSWMADRDEYWDSPEGREVTAERVRNEAALQAWLDANPDVTITEHGGMAPEQWYGAVDGHSFYFRERHDQWRIELDLRPSGRFYRAWVGGDFDDEASFEEREVEEGDIIADGNTGVDGYGATLVERAQFLANAIRAYLRRQNCDVHRYELDDLEFLCGRRLNWCPACGLRLFGDQATPW